MVDSEDHLIFTAKRNRRFFGIFGARQKSPSATLEIKSKGMLGTLKIPISESNGEFQKEIAGIAKDVTHNGMSLPFFHLLLYCGEEPYVASKKANSLAALAFRGQGPAGAYRFRSKVPRLGSDGKFERIEEIPEIAEESQKNVVIADDAGIVVFRMYKVAEDMVSLHALPIIGPLVGFAICLVVIE
jgi:hypothetical protein